MKLGAYEYFLFDWDGTLAQTPEIWIDAIEAELKNFGVANPSRAEIARKLGDFQIGFFYGLQGERETAFQEATVKRATDNLPKAELHDNAAAVLVQLRKQRKKLALITSSKQEWLVLTIKRHALTEAFDVIVTLDDVTNHKPHPEGVELALKKLGCRDKTKALMLGDTDKDIRAAHGAGIDSLLFYPSVHQNIYDFGHLQSFKPTYVVHDWREFVDQIT